jgi:hypothetical protein
VFLNNIAIPAQMNEFSLNKLMKDIGGTNIATFQTISKKLKRKSKIIAYAHRNKKGDEGYACILA